MIGGGERVPHPISPMNFREKDIHAVTNFKGQILHFCLAILFCKVNKEKENN